MKYLVQVRKGKGSWKTKLALSGKPDTDEGAAIERTVRFQYACTNLGPHWRKRIVEVRDDGAKWVLDSYVYPTIG
jgi:hypothetical protein